MQLLGKIFLPGSIDFGEIQKMVLLVHSYFQEKNPLHNMIDVWETIINNFIHTIVVS